MSDFYAGRERLDYLLSDHGAPIGEVVREVEHLCDREWQAAAYYRDHPGLLFPAHPWIRFVSSGNAAYLGWEAP